jgi:renalase
MPPRVAIVGAGMSGLSCATTLVKGGASVTVYDKGRAPAGRMSTRREAVQFDHGAQYFTARDEAFSFEISRLKDAGCVAEWTPRLVAIDAIDRVPRPATDVPRFVGVPGMSAVAHALAAPLDVQSRITVSSIARGADGWRLRSSEAELPGRFDAVVLTTPPSQAVPLLGAHPFTDTVASAEMAPCWAVMASWAEAVDVSFDAAFVNDGPLSWIARDGSKPGRTHPHAWVLHASAAWSVDHLELSAERVVPLLLRAFEAVVGRPVQAVSFATAHRWRYASVVRALEQSHLWDATAGLGVAGDWCGGPRVEGAWLSGRALARAILDA